MLVVSDAWGGSSQKRRGGNLGIYMNTNKSTHMREPGSTHFTMDHIYRATRNFSPSAMIGQGGFGTVYKGRLDDGTFVAVKRAKKVGYCPPKDFSGYVAKLLLGHSMLFT